MSGFIESKFIEGIVIVECIKHVDSAREGEINYFTKGVKYEASARLNLETDEFELYVTDDQENEHIISGSRHCFEYEFAKDEWFKEYFEFIEETV